MPDNGRLTECLLSNVTTVIVQSTPFPYVVGVFVCVELRYLRISDSLSFTYMYVYVVNLEGLACVFLQPWV